jgi:outer membrane protein assembly factor BamD
MSYYYQISDSKHDQEKTEQAKEAIHQTITKFPDSKYSKELKYKMDLVLEHLAAKEMEVGRFYQKKQEIIAAINRFSNVVKDYQTTIHIEEALARLVECYLSLGLVDDAKSYAAILGHNYLASSWYKYAFELIETQTK